MIRVAIGIDPGLALCGIAVITRQGPQEPWQRPHVQTVRAWPGNSLHGRMGQIHVCLRATLDQQALFAGIKHEEVVLACEHQSGVQEGKRRSGETNAAALLVQQVVGLVRAYALDRAFRFVEPTPAQVKAVLPGISRTASKAQVQRAVRALVPGCPKVMSEHASDAIAVALAGARMVPAGPFDYGVNVPLALKDSLIPKRGKR